MKSKSRKASKTPAPPEEDIFAIPPDVSDLPADDSMDLPPDAELDAPVEGAPPPFEAKLPADGPDPFVPEEKVESVREVGSVHLGGHVEYLVERKPWRCDRAAELFSFYGIVGTPEERLLQLQSWHRVFSQHGMHWKILCRTFTISKVAADTPLEDMRSWSAEEIAKEAMLEKNLLKRQVDDTRQHWQRMKMEKAMAEKMARTSRQFRARTEEETEDLLLKHGFAGLPEAERPLVVTRIDEMSALFEMQEARMLVQNAIWREIEMRALQKAIARKVSTGDFGKDYDDLAARFDSTSKSYEATMKAMGATQDQNPGHKAAAKFNDCIGIITRGIQDYYANEDNRLIDGIYTASEVQLLVTPTTLRPPQYRPDLPLLVAEWKREFWNPDYECKPLPTGIMRVLLKGFEGGIRAQLSEEGVSVPDMEASDDELAALATDAGITGGEDGVQGDPAKLTAADDMGGLLASPGLPMGGNSGAPRKPGTSGCYVSM